MPIKRCEFHTVCKRNSLPPLITPKTKHAKQQQYGLLNGLAEWSDRIKLEKWIRVCDEWLSTWTWYDFKMNNCHISIASCLQHYIQRRNKLYHPNGPASSSVHPFFGRFASDACKSTSLISLFSIFTTLNGEHFITSLLTKSTTMRSLLAHTFEFRH